MGMEPAVQRDRLTKMKFAELMLEQEGRCGCYKLRSLGQNFADYPVCGRKLDVREGITDEHLNPLACGGTNDMSNRALFRTPCARFKTAEYDNWLIKHVRHMGGGKGGQQARRARRKELTGSASSIPTRPPVPKQKGAKIQGGQRMQSANRWPAKGTQKIPPRANPWGRQ